MDKYYSTQSANGIVMLTNQRKQEIGQHLALHLSFVPGPLGSDGSVDGVITDAQQNLLAHFQSKLSSNPVGLDEAKILHSDLLRLKPKMCVYVAGVGYDDSFLRLIRGQPELSTVDIHLITLTDVLFQSDAYLKMLAKVPAHSGGSVNFARFRV